MFNQLITQAIKERRKLHFTYHGTKKPRGRIHMCLASQYQG